MINIHMRVADEDIVLIPWHITHDMSSRLWKSCGKPDCRSWKENAGYFEPFEYLKPPAYGLCFIAEEKDNLNSNWDTQINHREHGEADLYCLSALPVICSVLMAGDRFNLRVRTTGRKSRAV